MNGLHGQLRELNDGQGTPGGFCLLAAFEETFGLVTVDSSQTKTSRYGPGFDALPKGPEMACGLGWVNQQEQHNRTEPVYVTSILEWGILG